MKRIMWTPIPPMKDGDLEYILGFVIDFVDQLNDEPASKQIDVNYQHGGGWRPQSGWTIEFPNDPADSGDVPMIRYPGDPPLRAMARAVHQSERLFMFDYGYMAIVQQNGEFEVARLD